MSFVEKYLMYKKKYIELKKQNENELQLGGSDPSRKPFQCPHCPKSFEFESILRTHMTVHTNPLLCRYCPRTFPQAASQGWRMHELTHTGEKPELCTMCNERFSTATALTVHQKRAHGINYYPSTPEMNSAEFRNSLRDANRARIRELTLQHEEAARARARALQRDEADVVRTLASMHSSQNNETDAARILMSIQASQPSYAEQLQLQLQRQQEEREEEERQEEEYYRMFPHHRRY